MKKIYAILIAVCMSVNLFAQQPTQADLQSYMEEGYYVACFRAPVGSTCNDLYWVGSYCGWDISTDLENLVKCEELSGFPGWYLAKVPADQYNSGKPMQLNECGKLTWDAQPGTAAATELVAGYVTIEVTYSPEYDLYNWSTTEPTIITIGAWKDNYNPCVRQCNLQSYTIRIYPPSCEFLEPTIKGSFNQWDEALAMEFNGSYYEYVTEPVNANFEFKFNNDPNGDWDHQFAAYDAENDAWHSVPANGCFSLTNGTEYYTYDSINRILTFDFSDDAYYRYENCAQQEPEDTTLYYTIVIVHVPANAPAAGVEIIGSFDGWNGTLMEHLPTDCWFSELVATGNDEFKFREAGTWENEIVYAATGEGLSNFKFKDLWDDDYYNGAPCKWIELDLSRSEYRWKVNLYDVPELELLVNDSIAGYVNKTLYGDSIAIIEAIPNYGYYFSHWADGNTDNPRTLYLTQDTVMEAVFAYDNTLIGKRIYNFANIDYYEIFATNGFVDTYSIADGSSIPSVSMQEEGVLEVQINRTEGLTISYRNSTPKENIVRFYNDYMQANGKNFTLTFTDVTPGDSIKLWVSAKGSTNAIFTALDGAVGGDQEVSKIDDIDNYAIVSFVATSNTVQIKETSAGFRITQAIIGNYSPEIPGDTPGKYGTCGENITWILKNGVLTISGTGPMENHDLGSASCFIDKSSITSIIIGDSITSIGNCAFWSCESLTSVTIGNSVTSIGEYAFATCTRLTAVTIPNSVISISKGAFENCYGLSSIEIPNSVTSIGENAFLCPNLTTVFCTPQVPPTIGSGIFSNRSSILTIYVPCGSLDAYKTEWSEYASFIQCNSLYTLELLVNDSIAGYVNQTLYGDSIAIIEAIPNYGYKFLQWSDGIRYNPRTIVLTQDTSFTAEFGYAVTGACGENNQLTWTFDSISGTLSISGEGTLGSNYTFGLQAPTQTTRLIIEEGVTAIGDYAFDGMGTTVTSLALPTTLTNIGNYAFAGFNNRKFNSLVLPNGILSIGAHAFDGASYVQTIYFGSLLEEIGASAFNGCTRVRQMTCLAEITPNVGTDGLSSISSLAELYVPNDYLIDYQIDNNWNRFVLKTLGATEATAPEDDVIVEADDNTVTLTWPTNDNADTYTIVITKDGEVYCTLVFNANGQLIGIAFAPSRSGHPHAPAATLTVNGMQFTVTGLSSGANYEYSVVTKSGETVLDSYDGEFETTGAPEVATDLVTPSANMDEYRKLLRDGQILILRGDKTYTLTGQEVR